MGESPVQWLFNFKGIKMTFEKIVKIIKTQIENKNIDISMNSKLKDDIGLCSFDMMVIISIIERENFGLDIDMEKMTDDLTVADLLNAIRMEA